MSSWTNAQFMMWLREARVSSLSQEQLKIEAKKFSRKFEDLDKKTIAKVVENFEKEHKKMHADVSHSIFEELGGLEGKMRGRKDMPPKDYFPQDQTQLKMIKCENSQTKCEICDVFMSSMVEVTSSDETCRFTEESFFKGSHGQSIKSYQIPGLAKEKSYCQPNNIEALRQRTKTKASHCES